VPSRVKRGLNNGQVRMLVRLTTASTWQPRQSRGLQSNPRALPASPAALAGEAIDGADASRRTLALMG